MDTINTWLRDVFVTPSVLQTLVMLTLVSAIGLVLGKLRVGKLSLGITFVFFVGILGAHFGVRVNESMNSFAQTLGLTLFVYALGVEVGPSFFPSLKSQGILYNGLGLLLITLGLLFIVTRSWLPTPTRVQYQGTLPIPADHRRASREGCRPTGELSAWIG